MFADLRIVDLACLAGLDVQDSTLPDFRRLLRIGTDEILTDTAHLYNTFAIFDPWTGEKKWQGPQGVPVEVVGNSFVLLDHGDRIDVLRWR